MKYCPVCDAEYQNDATGCPDCGVELVSPEQRLAPLHESDRDDKIELLWKGGDPTAVSAIIATLREAGIRFHVQPTNDHMVFEFAMPCPKFAVRVFVADKKRAAELIADITETNPYTFEEQTAEDSSEEASPLPVPTPTPWNPAQATIELWKGSEISRADYLEACLAENQIGVRRVESQKQPGVYSLFIMPPDEPLALEILREITDSTPRA